MSSAKDATELFSNFLIKKSSMNLDNGDSEETLTQQSVSSSPDEYAICEDSVILLEISNNGYKLSNTPHIEVFQTNPYPVEGNEQTSVIETTALKDLAKVSNLIPQFENSEKLVYETAKTKIGKISTISRKFLDLKKSIAEKLFPTSQSNCLPLPDVLKRFNGMGTEKNLQQYTENAFPQKLQSEINQISGKSVDSKETITGVTTRNIESVFDDDCEIIWDYKEFEKRVNAKDTIRQVECHHEKQEFPKNHKNSKEMSCQYEETKNQIQTIVEPAIQSKKDSTDEIDFEFYKSPQSITSLDKKSEIITERNVTLSNSNMEKSINTELVEVENNPESIFILAREEKKLQKGLVEQEFVHHKISSGIITKSEDMFVPDKIKSLEDERIAEELVEEKLDQNEKSSEIIQAKVRKLGSSKEKFDLHEVSSKIDHANKEAAKNFLTESSDPEIGHMSETEDIPKDIGKKLDDINFSTSPDKISYINEVAKDVKVRLEIPTNETIKSALSSETKNIVMEISELPKHSTPAKSPICVESTTDLKAQTNQTLSEEVSLKATSSQVVEVKNSKRINPGNKQIVVKGKMEKYTKKDEKNVISCRQKSTFAQNKAAKFPLIASRKVGSKTTQPKLISDKIGKSIVTQAMLPPSFGQSDQTLNEQVSSLQATSSQAVEVKISKPCVNPGKKQTVVKGKMEKSTKIFEKNVISCHQKTTLAQNKAAKYPLIDKVRNKTSEPKIVSGKIVKSIVTQAKVPTSFGQSDSRKFESKPSHRYEAFGRLPLAKCPQRELKPAVKTFPAKSGLSNGNPSSKTNEGQKPLKSSELRTFPKQAVAAKVCSSSTTTVSSKTPAEENSASSSSTKISNSTDAIRNQQPNFPGKHTTKNPKDTKSEKPKWR